MDEKTVEQIIREHSSPTVGRGDVHDGQRGWIIYENELQFIVARLAATHSGTEPQLGAEQALADALDRDFATPAEATERIVVWLRSLGFDFADHFCLG